LIDWFFDGIYRYRLVLTQLVWQQLTLRYRRTSLGFLWTLLNPLLTMTVTSIVFSMIMRWPIKSFAVFLFSGLVPWIFFSSCIAQGAQALLNNESLIKKVYVPKQIFVVSVALGLLIDAIFSSVALFLMVLAIGAPLTWALIILPLNFLLLFLFSLGLALVLSVLTVYFRDLPNIVGVLLQTGYYLTPILYPLSMVPERFRWMFNLNPMTAFVGIFRAPIYEGLFPPQDAYFIVTTLAMVSLLFGIFVFRKFDRYVIFRL
jgi:ABC-type polysaccharide/polyol phosphate export permease